MTQTSREKYAADQARVLRERSGRTEHTVSVAPKQQWDADVEMYFHYYRAYCTCGMQSRRGSMDQGEEWARRHRENACQTPKLSHTAISEPETCSGAPRADEGAV